MSQHRYRLLEEKQPGNGTVDPEAFGGLQQFSKRSSIWTYILAVLLLISGVFNLLSYLSPAARTAVQYQYKSYIGHESNKDVVLEHWDLALDDPDWDDRRYNPFVGMIAVDDDFVQKNGLLPAQRFPWDTSKSMYYMSGFHSLHCVHVLRELLNEIQHGLPQTWSFRHAGHCLYSLRDDIVCYADDLPLYTGAKNAEVGHNPASPGIGQARKCRDWDRLLQFATDNTACYDPARAGRNSSVIDRYKFCPDGSKPWEKLEQS